MEMKKNKNLVKAQVIDKDFYANFESQVADDTILDKLTQMNPDILQLTLQMENKMFACSNNMRKEYLQFRTKAKRIQRFFGERVN